MKIAEVQKLVNRTEIVGQKRPTILEDLFAYLNTLVTQFHKAKQNIFDKTEIDFQEPLKIVANDLQINNLQPIVETEDFNLVRNLNLVDFATFLDIVIRTVAVKNSDLIKLTDLAAKNIFRTHINKQISDRLGKMFFEDHLEPWTNDYIDSLSSSEISLETQDLQKTMFDHERNHFYIFDIDGTLKEEESNCVSHVIPNIDDQVRKDLITLSQKPNTTVLILTSRPTDAIQESNLPYNIIPMITGAGRELINGNRHEVLVGDALMSETEKFVNHLHTLLKNLNISRDKYLIRQYAGSLYIQFIENNFTKAKVTAMKALEVLMANSLSGWSIENSDSKYIYFKNSQFQYDKGMALKEILTNYRDQINDKTNIYVLGDTSSDYTAMKALKEADLPNGVRKVNIAVGKELTDTKKYPHVDKRLSSYHAVADLLNWLAV